MFSGPVARRPTGRRRLPRDLSAEASVKAEALAKGDPFPPSSPGTSLPALAITSCARPAFLRITRTSNLKRSERLALIDALTAYPLSWSGNEGYKKAEVTGGGVALGEVDPKTLESKRVAGLYLCGEMLDAFGPIGGHNFSWAWATGRAAGIAAGTPDRRTSVEPSETAR